MRGLLFIVLTAVTAAAVPASVPTAVAVPASPVRPLPAVAPAPAAAARQPAAALAALAVPPTALSAPLVERISTAVPFPRGLEIVDGRLYAISRGRVREYGGVSADVIDRAGTLFEVDLGISAPGGPEVPQAVRSNGRVLAEPTSPPFRLWDRSANPPTNDRTTDRPYCGLRYHAASRNFFICAFSGIDKAEKQGTTPFSKNLSDALLRYDLRTGEWHEVERHDIEAGGLYPHHDPATAPAPHGWVNGPDNLLVVGDWLYVVAKDNSRLVRYDLSPIAADPQAGPPPSFFVLGDSIDVEGLGMQHFEGHSMLAARDGWLYIGFRTSSQIVRIPLAADGLPREPIRAQLMARFDPWNSETQTSANLTDMSIDPQGRVCVVSAKPARVFRFTPDPAHVFDAREDRQAPFIDLAALVGNPAMKGENVLVDTTGRVYITSGDAYDFQAGAGGVIWRVTLPDAAQ